MASATARSVLAVILCALAAEGKVEDKFWGFLDDVAGEGKEKSDGTTVAEILQHGGRIQVEDCGKKSDVMYVTSTEFDRSRLQVRAFGNLSRSVSGGTISVKMYKSSAAEGSSTGDWMKRELAWHSVPHKYEEDLCKHFGKSHSRSGCPLPAGSTELRFAVDKLPPMVVAGAYKLKIRAVDALDKQVVCVRAHVEIPRGKSGELFRRVQGVSTGHRGRALESVTGDCSCGFSDPVCGGDGTSYDGVCQAHCAKVDVAYAGKCVDQIVGPDGRQLWSGDMWTTTQPDWVDDDWSGDMWWTTTRPDWDDDWSGDMWWTTTKPDWDDDWSGDMWWTTTRPDWDDDWSGDMWWTTTKPDWDDWGDDDDDNDDNGNDWDDWDDWDDNGNDDCWCDDIWWPVCGHDGETYSSSCHADCYGGGVWMDGECETMVDGACSQSLTFTILLWVVALLQ